MKKPFPIRTFAKKYIITLGIFLLSLTAAMWIGIVYDYLTNNFVLSNFGQESEENIIIFIIKYIIALLFGIVLAGGYLLVLSEIQSIVIFFTMPYGTGIFSVAILATILWYLEKNNIQIPLCKNNSFNMFLILTTIFLLSFFFLDIPALHVPAIWITNPICC